MIVKPIARPAIDLNVPHSSDRAREDHPDQEEGQDRLDREALRAGHTLEKRGSQLQAVAQLGRVDPAQEQRGDYGPAELHRPVDDRER